MSKVGLNSPATYTLLPPSVAAEEGIVRYLSNLYEVQNRDKSLFDAVEYESEVEKEFARDLDSQRERQALRQVALMVQNRYAH